MRKRSTSSDRLNPRFPVPQSNSGTLAPGESSAVQDRPYYASPPVEVAPQDDAPQKVESIAGTLSFASAAAIPTPSASLDSSSPSTLESSTETLASSSSSFVSATVLPASVTDSSSSTTASSSTSPVVSSHVPLSFSISSPSSSFVSSAASASSSDSPPSSIIALASASASISSAATVPPQNMTHGAPFYAAIVLGALILFAFVAAIVACLFRIRNRRRESREAVSKIAWDPVVLANDKEPTAPDLFSFTGDRDVGEPKRSASVLSSRASYPHPFDTSYHQHQPQFDPYQQHPNPFADTANYYSPHHVPPLADSAAYPLPPIPLSDGGPYPTARPLPAHLADRDPHRASFGTSTSARRSARSAASSRSGSVCSHLPSASTLCVTNGSASRASTALGVHEEQDEEGDEAERIRAPQDANFAAGFGAPFAQSAHELGTAREQVMARPRFMSLGDGRGLEVPWRRESFAVRGGGEPGWAPLRAPDTGHLDESQTQGQGGEGWTQAIRASVLHALHAVTGAGATTPNSDDEARVDGGDGLTLGHAPSTRRERREEGWRRFAQRERERELERKRSMSSRGSTIGIGGGGGYLQPPAVGLQPSMASDVTATNQSLRTNNSQVPLIPRPRPALMSRTSSTTDSLYSTMSAVPPMPPMPAYGYGSRGK
ncbi:hypothetical protein C8F04DRAFT_1392776 [Mycena alexandri]|uniref:Uncharacterized protein n=1 Tax=Mycena alexandri TaxID=1745969 RepID=A0AAD6T3X3_9AGAR|nr:hypothetical protein C8F04DRAFT_1392776 [Mycena alexandri]